MFLLQHPIHLLLPHCASRASVSSREPIVKQFVNFEWSELTTEETTVDDHKVGFLESKKLHLELPVVTSQC